MSKVLVAMSGGVDSAVAAYLLQGQGYECIGCTMRLHSLSEGACGGGRDAEVAASICRRLGITHTVRDYSCEFEREIIAPFVRCYEAGRTPNPCIECNRRMKFDRLYRYAEELGCDYIATGHYARIDKADGRYMLQRAADPGKDQSYVLYHLSEDMLRRTLFPLGGLSKTEVRRIAAEQGFENADKPDSQDICFVPDGDYASVIKAHSGREYPPGDLRHTDGRILGRHRGIIHYTVGQRKGLGIAHECPLYVCRIDTGTNTVWLCEDKDLFSARAIATDIYPRCSMEPNTPLSCAAKIRYRHAATPATAVYDGERLTVTFDAPQRAVTPGQSLVLYDCEGHVLCGGVITS